MSKPEKVMGPEGVKIPQYRVNITFDPMRGLNVDVPDDPIMAFGLLELAKEVVRSKLNVQRSPIVRPK